MDAMRTELVNKLAVSLRQADQILENYEASRRRKNQQSIMDQIDAATEDGEDPFLDADLEILKDFETNSFFDEETIQDPVDNQQAVLVISNNSTDSEFTDETLMVPSPEEVEDAQKTTRVVRDYLPQLVSVVLRSPPAFEPHLINPIEKLRQLIIHRCMDDANWGVDMCWLLEAEVGRAWKQLFEHRQQTGRRLIVVLPAEKAAVLAKIGTEKREAFDLLQDAEQATAYGYTMDMDETLYYQGYQPYTNYHPKRSNSQSRLPSSLSLRRCSHFGDTMHFIDRLTKISMDLRHVPAIHRHACLQDMLEEMNRRIRRRMVTRGDVSLDVEDNRGPYEWPQLNEISSDLLQFSVHLPLDPRQHAQWPGGDKKTKTNKGGVVRVLNIVVDESRILSSRERCPFLLHVEVAETGLSGTDSRLYATGAPGLGATVAEALSLSANRAKEKRSNAATYQIPSELLESTAFPTEPESTAGCATTYHPSKEPDLVRGGHFSDESVFYAHNPDELWSSNGWDDVRQSEYEQLHEQLYVQQQQGAAPQYPADVSREVTVSTREALLDKVFGQPWAEKCEEIRQASPFGKTEGWRLASFIIKAGEDIRREALVMQIISKLNEWFQTDIPEGDRPHMRPYTIMCVGGDAGLVECLADAKSIDEVKKKTDGFESLRDYFIRAYGPPTTHSMQYANAKAAAGDPKGKLLPTFEEAQDNFLRSLVGYSLVCYILQIKDRHNANILLDREGNVMHIDFGFVLGDTPKMGKVPIFSERAPFKLSQEFWDVLGGWNLNQGGLGVRFCLMFEQAFACASAHTEEIVSLVEATMLTLTQSPRQARLLANGVRSRLRMRGPAGSTAQKQFIMELVNAALTSWGTSTYDWLQRNMNGYQ